MYSQTKFSILLALLFSMSLESSWANIVKFKYEDIDGYRCTASYDSNLIKKIEVENSAKALGRSSMFIVNSIKMCNMSLNKNYKECGSNKYGDKYFLHNAKVNLDENQNIIIKFEQLQTPRKISVLKARLLEDLKFSNALETARYKFYLTLDPTFLKEFKFSNIDITNCNLMVNFKDLLKEAVENYIDYTWHNCVNGKYLRVLESETVKAWKSLLISEVCEGGHI